MRKIIEQKVSNGYSLDLGKLIDESFATFKKTFLIAGLDMFEITDNKFAAISSLMLIFLPF